MKKVVKSERWEGTRLRRHRIRRQQFANIYFQDLTIRFAELSDCSFEKCDFKNCYIGFNVRYSNCTWSECKFHGKCMTFGDHSRFEDCKFENVTIQSADTDGATFQNCIISGDLRNMIWRGTASKAIGNMILDRCDLSAAVFDNINIYAGLNLANCRLPAQGIRVFNNLNGAFSRALSKVSTTVDKDIRIPLEVLGNEDCYAQQNPVVHDVRGLNELLGSDEARKLFETVAKEYEITQQENAADR
jgi:hypothetical protein